MSERGWRSSQLKELVSIKHGFAFAGEYFREQPFAFKLVTPGNFAIGGGFHDSTDKFYSGPIPEEYILSPNDLLVTMTDLSKKSDTLGYPGFVPDIFGFQFLHNQRIGKISRLEYAEIDTRFLYYVLCSAPYRHEILASASGSTVRHTSPNRILNYQFDCPPIDEQRAIAGILGALDDKIEVNRRMNQTLEEIARTIFTSWFVRFDPVRAKAAGRQPDGMDAETAALFPGSFADSELGPIPAGWEVRPLDQIATFLNGLALQKFPVVGDDWLPAIKIAQLRQGNSAGADRVGANVPPDYIVGDGDILFSWSGSLEVEAWCGGRGALNQHLFKVTSDEFPKWFYYHWLLVHLDGFRAIAASKATTMGHIQRRHLTEALVVVAPSETTEAISATMGPLLDQQIANNLESRTLAQLREVLLPKLLSGELRVPEAERALAEVTA